MSLPWYTYVVCMYRLPIYILNEDKHPVSNTRDRSHTQLAKMSFDKIFDLTAGSVFLFLYYVIPGTGLHNQV